MSRLIDADELITFEYGGIKFVPKEFIDDAPTIQPEQKTGRWRPIQIGKWHGFECTSCKISREVPCSNNGRPQWKYCPECGSYNGGEE